VTLYFPEDGAREVMFSFHTNLVGNYRGFFLDYIQETCKASLVNGTSSNAYLRSSFSSPMYPLNYIAKAKMEEIVEAKVQVLDSPSLQKPKLKPTSASSSSGSTYASETIYVSSPSKSSRYLP
jgi:hypothetical protein